MNATVRSDLLMVLANPNYDVLLCLIGSLLVCLECNMPGKVLPGALGTLLLLLGAFGLGQLPLSDGAVALLLGALIIIILEVKFASRGVLAVCGIIGLMLGMASLVLGSAGSPQLNQWVALGSGFVFGAITYLLALIAFRARRNKLAPRNLATEIS